MKAHLLSTVLKTLESIPTEEQARIIAHVKTLEENPKDLVVKKLKGKIQELIVRQYRIVFCIKDTDIYVIDLFKKQSKKTPKRVIEHAVQILRHLSHP
jgi:phage-related protein